MATTPTTEQIGRVLGGRYRLLAPLGSGASAQVFLADDVRLRRRVAVKVLHPALADDESFLRRFRAEAQSTASLSHPHLLAVYDWSDEGTPFLVTEYLGGGSLRTMLDAGHRLSPAQALVVGLEAARGLDHAHRHGFVHRDIKPANLLFGSEGRLRIADFGLARAIAEAGWTEPTGAVLGTARYASPEQARGESLDGRSDVYSLAVVLIEAVTGEVPFVADTTIGTLMARLNGSLEVPDELGPLQTLLAAAGCVDHDERPDAGAFGRALVEAASELTRPAPLPLEGPPADIAHDGGRDATLLGPGPVAAVGAGSVGAAAVARAERAGVRSAGGSTAEAGAAGATTEVALSPHAGDRPALDETATQDATRRATVREPVGGVPSHGAPVPPWRTAQHEPHEMSSNDRSARRLMIGAVVVVLAVTVGLVGGWFYVQSQIPSYPVPDGLVGLQRDALPSRIDAFDWKIDDERIRRDGTEPGEILETRPAAGEELREGSTLHVVVSDGATLVDVPTGLAGMSADDATAALQAAGLDVALTPQRSDEVDEGVVIGFADGDPGAQLPKGSVVRLAVSSGDEFEVPDVRGMSFDEAVAELEAMGLSVEVEADDDDDVEPGQVIGTDPEEGDEVEPGDSVTVVVAVDEVEVPEVRGTSVEEATEKLEDEGLTVGRIVGPDDGEVVATWPLEGSEASSGTPVNLVTRRR